MKTMDLAAWHQSTELTDFRNQLNDGVWPAECRRCQDQENEQFISFRQSNNNSLSEFSPTDIFLSVLAGSTCNYACQTCNPAQSSKIRGYMNKFNVVPEVSYPILGIPDPSFLNPIKHRVKELVVSGGEPFYDINCKKILDWSKSTSTLLRVVTNGSINLASFISSYTNNLIVIFSIDATGSLFEYVRFGGSWDETAKNYESTLNTTAEIHINAVVSSYNFHKLPDLIDYCILHQPKVLAISYVRQPELREASIPIKFRKSIIDGLESCINKINTTNFTGANKNFTSDQLLVIIDKLKTLPFDQELHSKWRKYVIQNDMIRGISIADYDPLLAEMLNISAVGHDL